MNGTIDRLERGMKNSNFSLAGEKKTSLILLYLNCSTPGFVNRQEISTNSLLQERRQPRPSRDILFQTPFPSHFVSGPFPFSL